MSNLVDEHIESLLRAKDAWNLKLIDCKKRLADVREEKRLIELRYKTTLIDLENACIVKSKQESK